MAKKTSDAKERAAAAGINPDGVDDSPIDLDALQEAEDRIQEKGYIGITPDPTPDENYSLLTPPDAPTPETDDDLFNEARKSSHGTPRTAINRTAAEVARGDTDKEE